MKRRRLIVRNKAIVFLGTITLLLNCVAAPALAGKAVTVQIKVLMSGPQAETQPAGDDKNHYVGMGQRKGRAEFSDGRNADYSNVFLMDIFRGQYSRAWGYTKMAFNDTSFIFFKWDAEFAGFDEDGNPSMAGKGVLLKGTGDYGGIKGTVNFKNNRMQPNDEFPHGGTEARAVLTYTLPDK